MIAELGLASLWLAAGLCMLQFIAGAIGARSEEQGPVAALVRPAAIVQAVLLVISLGWSIARMRCPPLSTQVEIAVACSVRRLMARAEWR